LTFSNVSSKSLLSSFSCFLFPLPFFIEIYKFSYDTVNTLLSIQHLNLVFTWALFWF
jgi:hypothetical protein